MSEQADAPIVVGVTGRGENTAALRYAAQLAEQDKRRIVLAHATHHTLPPPAASALVASDPIEDVGRRLLAQVVDEAKSLGIDEPEAVSRPDAAMHLLTELSRTASMVIIQHRRLSEVRRVFTGSTSAGVAAHAHCPVTSVPEGWRPESPFGKVTVGVDEYGGPSGVLRLGFESAAALGASVTVLHAWRMETTYDDLIVKRVGVEPWREHVLEHLSTAVKAASAEHPDVKVDVQTEYKWAADALQEASSHSDLLILGRHSRPTALSLALGSLSRALIRHAHCPVLVMPEPKSA